MLEDTRREDEDDMLDQQLERRTSGYLGVVNANYMENQFKSTVIGTSAEDGD